MNNLSKLYIFKISATVFLWCVPLILFPATLLESAGLPALETTMFVRLLGWAYLALCVGYAFGLQASLKGEKLAGPIWAGIVSNGGASVYLTYFGLIGTWDSWGIFIQIIAWGSAAGTALITLGLFWFGVRQAPSLR